MTEISNAETTRKILRAMETGDTNTMKNILAENFVFEHGSMPDQKWGRTDFIEMVQAMRRAMPDLRFQIKNLQDGEPVRGTIVLSGTHRGVLDIPGQDDIPPVQPTGNTVKLPEEPTTWRVKSGHITHFHVEKTEGGGMPGILGQIGVHLPAT